MKSKIEIFLNSATSGFDKELRRNIISIHDDLYAAHKIIESVSSSIGDSTSYSNEVLLAVFHELRKNAQ